MKLLFGFSLCAAALLHAGSPAVNPAKQIYDAGIELTEQGKLADARAILRGLIDAYPNDPMALPAKGAVDATLLFEEAQAHVKAGKYDTARVAFETLIAVYPENPLAERAKSALAAITDKEKLSRPVVQSLEFHDVAVMPADQIQAAMEARELRLTVGQPCRAKDVEQAKIALTEILAEKGVSHFRVEARKRTVQPNAVAVVFIVEKYHPTLLTPWRLLHRG
jgi:outer membrane protein assembly factor BamD (BamD/ComL family)